ncbi:MAG: acetoacetate decarboxylase family protein [Xenophilus sp.]
MLSDDPELKPQFRMPRVFGALPGPRNVPASRRGLRNNQHSMSLLVSFDTDGDALAQLLPPGCQLDGPPVVTVSLTYLSSIGWLAGRGYSILVVGFPIRHTTASGEVLLGKFVPVVWENLADPIITGRDELGWSKLYADIPPAVIVGDGYHGRALWDGFKFFDIAVRDAQEAPLLQPAMEGSFHYKYVPTTGGGGSADVDYLEYAPPGVSATGYGGMEITRTLRGTGSVAFHRAAWEDVPFQYPIINALASLPVKGTTNAWVTFASAGAAIGDPSPGALRKIP